MLNLLSTQHIPFGVFNPRFYGVSIFLSGNDRRNAMERYMRIKDVGEWSKDTGAQLLNDISMLSSVDHEIRHFHDFLISPLGTITMGLRMQASINGFQAMKALGQCHNRFVPIPLGRWIEWDTAARQSWIDSTGSFFGIGNLDDIVPLPYVADISNAQPQVGAHAVPESLSPELRLDKYSLGAAQAYTTMKMLRQRRISEFDMEVSADDVFEATAHLVQMQAVWTGQGEAAAQSFLDFVLTSSADHILALQVLWTALQKASCKLTVQRATELFTWMLLGPWEELISTGDPASRFFEVLELAVMKPDHDVLVGSMSAGQVFDCLDSLTQNSVWRHNLASALASANRRMDFYTALTQILKGGYFDSLFAVGEAWHRDQSLARQTFLSEPDSLTNPLRYINEKRFPIPYLETRLGWMVHEREDVVDSTNHRAIAVDPQGKRILSYISKLDSRLASEELDHVVTARLLTHMVDFLFTDEPVVDLYEAWCRSQVQLLTEKQLISVY